MRLTKLMKESIVRELTDEKDPKAEIDKLNKESEQQAKNWFINQLSEKEWELFNSIPQKWFPIITYVRVQIAGGLCVLVNFEGGIRVPHHMADRWFTIDREDKVGHEIAKRMDKVKSLRNEYSQLIFKVERAVEQFTTDNKLIENWPECEPVVRKVVAMYSSNTKQEVAVPTRELNRALGLPKGSNAA